MFKNSNPIQKLEFVTLKFRDLKNCNNTPRFIDELSKINFDFVYDSELDLEAKFEKFVLLFWNCYNECFPLKTKQVSSKRLINRWLTPEIRKEINRKHEMYKLKLQGDIPNEMYAKFNSYVNKLIFRAKKDYFSNKLDEINGDMRKHWKFLNEITNRNPKRNSISNIETDHEILSSTPPIAKNFNSHFSKIGYKIQSGIQSTTDPLEYLNNIKHNCKFKFNVISVQKIENIIKSLKNKSSDCNTIPNKIYKLAAPIISLPLQVLINQSLIEGIFPSQFKCAIVVPIFKAGSKKSMNNYRPISILHTISKIIEKIVNEQILDYFNSNSLFTQFQFDFRKKHSTQDANNLMLDFVYKKLNSKSNIIITLWA